MADPKLRELERRWLLDPSDQAALTTAIAEHRRAGRSVPPAMLDAQVFPEMTFRAKATFQVTVEKPDGRVEELGETGKGSLEVPRHRAWWVAPLLRVRRRYNSVAAAHPEQQRLLRSALAEVAKRGVPGLALQTPELFASASSLLHLEALDLRGSPVQSGLAPMTRFERLRRLDLTHTRFEFRPLREMRELVNLIVVGCPNSDLNHVPPSVCRLELGWVDALDTTLAGIEALPSLTHLRVGGEVGDVGAGHISRVARLVELRFDHAGLTDAGLRKLAKGLPNLEVLALDRCQGITDKGMAAIGTMSSLRRLSLDDCGRVTAKGIARLAALTNLKAVYVRAAAHLHLTADRTKARIALREALPGCKVY